jgi:hypothetical protein
MRARALPRTLSTHKTHRKKKYSLPQECISPADTACRRTGGGVACQVNTPIRMYTYVCIYIHTYVYIHACMHTYIRIQTHVLYTIHTNIHTYLYACMHEMIRMFYITYVHTYMHVYMMCMHACMHISEVQHAQSRRINNGKICMK